MQGHEPDGSPWQEMTTTLDVSLQGASLLIRHRLLPGQVLMLSLPLPKSLRRYDLVATAYRTWALVRHVTSGEPARSIGVMFLGRNPPAGYAEKPGGLYLFASDLVHREFPRYEFFLNVRLRRLRPAGAGPAEETTVTENIGEGGVLVRSSLPVAKGELVEIEEPGGTLRASGEVLNVTMGEDGMTRLRIRFLDAGAAAAVREVLRKAGFLMGGSEE